MEWLRIQDQVDNILCCTLPKAFRMTDDLDNEIFSRSPPKTADERVMMLVAVEQRCPTLAILQDQLLNIKKNLERLSSSVEAARNKARLTENAVSTCRSGIVADGNDKLKPALLTIVDKLSSANVQRLYKMAVRLYANVDTEKVVEA